MYIYIYIYSKIFHIIIYSMAKGGEVIELGEITEEAKKGGDDVDETGGFEPGAASTPYQNGKQTPITIPPNCH